MPTKQCSCPVELPEPVWTIVARHLSLKDWVKASGTCRTTFDLKLQTLYIPSLPPSGWRWVCKRLSCAVIVALITYDLQELADSLGQGQNKLDSLQQLQIWGDDSAEENWTVATIMSFLWLLASAPNLSFLMADVGAELPWFPPLSQLQHLVLIFHANIGNVFAKLQKLEKLETLALQTGPDAVDAPLLELDMMPNLHAVGLCCIRPAGTRLPVNCRLTLSGLEEADFTSSAWDSVLSNVSEFVFAREEHVFADILPQLFGSLQNLTIVKIRVCEAGSTDAFLPLDGLSHVRTVYLCGENLYSNVPAKVCWESFSVQSECELGLAFASTSAFALSVPYVRFEYELMRGSALFNLTSAWAACNRRWAGSLDDPDNMLSCAKLKSPPCCKFNYYDCCCEACLGCLTTSGTVKKFHI